MKKIEVGETVFIKAIHREKRLVPYVATITEVGNKYFMVTGLPYTKFLKKDLSQKPNKGFGYAVEYICYESEDAYNEKQRIISNIGYIKENLNSLTNDEILHFVEVINKKNQP